jgi:hypothetical protein
MTISVTTSLVPGRDVELQLAAITSWKHHGFHVTSINAQSEIIDVGKQFPNVSVVTAERTGEKVAGKPLPFVVDLLRIASAQHPGADVVGFMNSDIILRPQANLASILADSGTSSAILLPRVDIPDLKSTATFSPTGRETYSIGYDGIFLPPRMIASIPDSLFCIGMPFWDYWLPLMLILQGHDVKAIASPVALHVQHATRWDQSIYLFFHALMSDALKVSGSQNQTARSPAFEIAIDMLQHSYSDIFQRATQANADSASMDSLAHFYDRIQEVVVHHIKAKAQPLSVPDAFLCAT